MPQALKRGCDASAIPAIDDLPDADLIGILARSLGEIAGGFRGIANAVSVYACLLAVRAEFRDRLCKGLFARLKRLRVGPA